MQNGTPRQVGPLKKVTGEWAEDAPAVHEGLIAAHFPDARVEASHSSSVPKARGCDWATARKIVILKTGPSSARPLLKKVVLRKTI